MNQPKETLSVILPKFINNLDEKGRSPSTILAYSSDIDQLVEYLKRTNKVFPEDVVQTDIEKFRDFLMEQKYTAKSVSRKLNAVKTFFRWMKGQKYITKDTSKDVLHPQIESTIPKFLSPLEYRALRDVVRSDKRVAAIVELILQTGLRISEVAGLKIKNIKKRSITVEAYATQLERTITLNSAAREAVEDYIRIRPNHDSEYLFISKNGRPLAVRNIRAAIDRYMQKAGIPDYSVNDLRTTFVVENLKAGVDLVTVSQAAGHKRLSTTEKYLELAGREEPGKRTELQEL